MDDKTESEQMFEHVSAAVDELNELLTAKLYQLELRIANLEARKPPQDTNPDPEWFS